jgi:hypothetical protein
MCKRCDRHACAQQWLKPRCQAKRPMGPMVCLPHKVCDAFARPITEKESGQDRVRGKCREFAHWISRQAFMKCSAQHQRQEGCFIWSAGEEWLCDEEVIRSINFRSKLPHRALAVGAGDESRGRSLTPESLCFVSSGPSCLCISPFCALSWR